MAQAQKVLKDEYTADGQRMCNLTKPLGMIYSDGFSEAKYLQDGQYYRGDRTPIEGMIQRPNDPPKDIVLETTPEEVAVAKRMDKLEAEVGDLKTGINQILQLLAEPKKKA